MRWRARWGGLICLMLLAGAAWIGSASSEQAKSGNGWTEVLPQIWRTDTPPYGYAVVVDRHAFLIDAPDAAEGLRQAARLQAIESVWLTHHHHDTCRAVGALLQAKVPVRAAPAGLEWLRTADVCKFWAEAIPLRSSRTAYFVLPEGVEGIDGSLVEGTSFDWRGWNFRVVATPGHSRDHLAFAVTPPQSEAKGPIVFTGDAFTAPGQLWTPFTTDWDHWTDMGLKPAAESLRKLAQLRPVALLPAHGPIVTNDPVAALEWTAKRVEEVGFLKSFERFSRRRGQVPQYAFLAKDQVGSAGEKPWTQVSEHLFLTGNTYVLVSEHEKAFLVFDPWGERSAQQIAKLKKERQLGKLEVVMFSHAHYDHFDGIYHLPQRETFQVWATDVVAQPIAEPYLFRAPFLDARPVRFDRLFREGDTTTWREYRFRFHHLPGQSYFTMGVETEIDGKRCMFTGDNWFHMEQYSGSGGWMGLNRSSPRFYSESAQKVLERKPQWVIAEHGGPFEFSEEDFRRRVEWGRVAAAACDAISPSGNHLVDWDPHRVRVVPYWLQARPGQLVRLRLEIDNPRNVRHRSEVRLDGRGLVQDQQWSIDVPPAGKQTRDFTLIAPATKGRHIFIVRELPDSTDGFVAIDVE